MEKEELLDKAICGVVLPISEIDGCGAAHWIDCGFRLNLLEDSEYETGACWGIE